MQTYDTTTIGAPLNFQYPDKNAPLFAELKKLTNIQLDPIASQLDQAVAIISYAHGLFTHDGDNEPSSFDPLTIIKEAQAGQSFRCVEYSHLAAALLWAHAIPARTIGLKTSDVETREYGAGHVVIEFWDGTKWIMCDVQAGIIPTSDGQGLSAFGLGERIRQDLAVDGIELVNSRFSNSFGTISDYCKWIAEYLYFYDTPLKLNFEPIVDRREEQIVMLVPLGVKPPEMFQGLFKMNAIYMQSVKGFYKVPALKFWS
jgi:Transglutaminase-like superfamily